MKRTYDFVDEDIEIVSQHINELYIQRKRWASADNVLEGKLAQLTLEQKPAVSRLSTIQEGIETDSDDSDNIPEKDSMEFQELKLFGRESVRNTNSPTKSTIVNGTNTPTIQRLLKRPKTPTKALLTPNIHKPSLIKHQKFTSPPDSWVFPETKFTFNSPFKMYGSSKTMPLKMNPEHSQLVLYRSVLSSSENIQIPFPFDTQMKKSDDDCN
ncbi:hypothetical protein BC833DRAFT_596598 [Globomyces pollinis-pini]|nr:hypothetical protein BC833DRAFT_596598 [Globomyces pollinis-pini]